MTLRVSMDPSRGRGHVHGRGTDLESGKQTSARGYEGHEAAAADPVASAEQPRVGAAALSGGRAET
jgi:hypothetical protein